MKIYRVQCFGRTHESGNAAIVVENAALTEPERQVFARQQNANATVFVDVNAEGERQLDYYYPHTRSPLCLHATLAASAVLFHDSPDRASARFVTRMHRQTLEIERMDATIFVAVKAQPCPDLDFDIAEIAELLRADPADLIAVRGPSSVGSAKLLVEVASPSALEALRPDLAGIVGWGRQHAVSGMYAYCRLDDGVYAGRNFNHLDPSFEDTATGVAAGALALSLERNLTLLQGDLLGQPCTLVARYQSGTVQIGGRAVLLSA
ncbi:Phenazine biosynthesis protein [Paraburkholderia tropica]|uniref:PhzF family phenazine biosynthesis protein n=1 Tax=Paraburkholderia tropica TaxID=92647 RepID=UPI001CB1FE23|nr:PhzF family phenazine biosynthesis protein [Paraburkholderia tropica]CAG9226878.1 Phenazine biosynthesis protein [Paraburkholderia tropica]